MLINQLHCDELGISYAGSSALWKKPGLSPHVARINILRLRLLGVESGLYLGSQVDMDVYVRNYGKKLLAYLSEDLPWLYSVTSNRNLAYSKVAKYSKYLSDNGALHGFGGLTALYLAIYAGLHFEPDVMYIFPADPVNKIYEDGSYNSDPHLIMRKTREGTLFEIGLTYRSNFFVAGTRLVLAGTKYEPAKYMSAPGSAVTIGRKR